MILGGCQVKKENDYLEKNKNIKIDKFYYNRLVKINKLFLFIKKYILIK